VSDQLCQSCSMPIGDRKLLGTEKDGTLSLDYCIYCYEKGEFKQPSIDMEQMIEMCVPHMKEHGMDGSEARKRLNRQLPQLKRWK